MSYPILFDRERIRFGRFSSGADVQATFHGVFDRAMSGELLDWYAQAPVGPNDWYGAFEDGVPVGMYGLLPIRVRVGGRILAAALCNNVGIVPRHRGTGLFQALGEFALGVAALPLVIGVPNAASVKGHKRIGWKSYGTLDLLEGSGAAEASIPPSVGVERFQYVSDTSPAPFHVVRDDAMFRWRYSRPGYEYRQTLFESGHYAIWKRYGDKIQILETNDPGLARHFPGIVDLWHFRGSRGADLLTDCGFTAAMSNEFILYTNEAIPGDCNDYRFELCDNDVF